MMKRGEKLQNIETDDVIVFHHYRPLSYWTSFRREDNPSIKVHLPPVTVILKLTEWQPDEESGE